MKNIQEIHKKLAKQCPVGYQINEIIRFAYPYRELKIKAIVNKSPEKSIQQIYATFLKTIKAGFSKEVDFIQFLGLYEKDFLLKELYFLKEKGFVEVISDIWSVTEIGESYIKDNSVLQVLEEEHFSFLIDGLTDKVLPFAKLYHEKTTDKKFNFEINYKNRNPEILKNKNEQLADIYKASKTEQAYLIDYDKEKILFDKEKWNDYFLIEYKPNKAKQDTAETFIEVRNIDADFSKDKDLTKALWNKYELIINDFSNSERTSFAKIKEDKKSTTAFEKAHKVNISVKKEMEELPIWETQTKFEEALKTVKKRILIESPWIKKATLQYIPLMEKALKKGIQIFILYGMERNDEHDYRTMKKLQELRSKFPAFLNLIHLPSHFEYLGNMEMTGTHRKLLIKDNDYYISGSFNFLSFNRKEGQTIANEESILIRRNVVNKWEKVFKEYKLRSISFF